METLEISDADTAKPLDKSVLHEFRLKLQGKKDMM